MNTGLRIHESATLTVAIPQCVPEHMRDGMRELISVFTPPEDRRKGYATALLKAVCEEADATAMVLLLTAEDPLIGFYRRFGFIELPREPHGKQQLARQPRLRTNYIRNSIRSALH